MSDRRLKHVEVMHESLVGHTCARVTLVIGIECKYRSSCDFSYINRHLDPLSPLEFSPALE